MTADRPPAPRPDGRADRPEEGLCDREEQVLQLIAQSHSLYETAAALGLTVETVTTYKDRAVRKLGLQSRVDIVRYAEARGWLAASPAS